MSKRYRIGQAAEKLGLNTSVLRYWESEFEQVEPLRTRKGQRVYAEEHIELLERIRVMLHEEGLTIEGAKKRLEQAEEACGIDGDQPAEGGDLKREMVEELKELKRLLGGC